MFPARYAAPSGFLTHEGNPVFSVVERADEIGSRRGGGDGSDRRWRKETAAGK
jgi:hypothetical protein